MTKHAARLLEEVLKLSEGERVEFAAALLASLDGPEPSAEERAEIEAAWQAEIGRRLQQFQAGGHAIPWEQVRARLRAARGGR